MNIVFSISRAKLIWGVFFFFMFILFLESLHAYFFWSIPFIIPAIVSTFSIFFIVRNSRYFSFSKRNIVPFSLFLLTLLYTRRDQNLNGYIGSLLPFISLFLIFTLKLEYKAKFLESLTKCLSGILFISLFAWILVMLGAELPHVDLFYEGRNKLYTLNCYYVFIEYTFVSLVFQRFMSIFIEPGYLAALLAVLIYINNFQLRRKEVLILFLSIIFTFSLAGYLMLSVAYISHLLRGNKHAIKNLLLSIIALVIAYNMAVSINNGNNVFNELVINRLSINDEGGISGYNRTNKRMDQQFVDFLKSDNLISGIGENYKHYGGNVGYKPYIIINGLVGLFLLLISYFSGWFYNMRLFSLTISVLFIMMFSKGHSEIFWAGYLMVYASSMYLSDDWRERYIIINSR